MIPLSDVIPARTRPLVTVAAISLTSLVFACQQAGASAFDLAPFAAHGPIPLLPRLRGLLTSMFVPAGWTSFLASMLSLWIFGGTVEDRLGHGRFAAFYVLCGASAIAAHVMLSPAAEARLVGSGGAVAGVLGGYFLLYPNSRVLTLVPLPPVLIELPAVIVLGLWMAAQLAAALAVPGEAQAVRLSASSALGAYAAGFATGAVACALMRRPERLKVDWWGGE